MECLARRCQSLELRATLSSEARSKELRSIFLGRPIDLPPDGPDD
jgi:hypothetical protein